jgi:hypothetical protein
MPNQSSVKNVSRGELQGDDDFSSVRNRALKLAAFFHAGAKCR